MRLDTGTRLGNYEVVAPLGAGGMGEVYRARDATLRRDVAIKVVNPQYCAHPDSRDRLRREARALAALNHPHVAAVHEFGESDSGCYIVMEYVAGQTLLDVLEAGPPSLHDCLRTCLQVATALEAAHDRGLIHRDLKPANVRVTPEGIVKVLDFGLARQDPAVEAGDLDHPSTFGTEAGSVVGTASYMSPEQARGRPVDRRTDIWAFGCLLFELLAGRRVFSGPTTSDTFVAILEREPEWSLLPHQTPPAIRRLLRRCLEKDAARRLRDMGDARLEIEDALSPAGAEPQGALRTDRRLSWVTLAAAVLLGAAAGGALARFGLPRPAATPSNPPARFVVPLGFGARLSQTDFPALAMSADGAVMAYAARRGDRSQLFVRRLDAPEPVAVAGSTDAVSPFFSPDGQWIAFFADGKLKKAPI
ncbi:MAG: protein kinase domain-containing protein, partial [Acidobacteriota bacterium]